MPAGCSITGATLRLFNNSPKAGRTIGVYRADPAAPLWTETGVTWGNRPSPVGTPVTSNTVALQGWQQWTVTAHVEALRIGPNSGFVVKDQTDNDALGQQQDYLSREGGSPPQLIVSWG